MKHSTRLRLGVVFALLLGLGPVLWCWAGGTSGLKTQHYKGKVMPLAKALEKHGVKLDPDAGSAWMVLVTDEGKVYPLIKDDGGRMFFKDTRLLNRPMRITGRIL